MGPLGPKLAHLVPPQWSIVVQVKKVIRNVEISCFSTKGQNRSKKPLFPIISVIFFRGRLLRFLHLLLQFSTDFDKTGGIFFTIGWSNFSLFRILNFYLKKNGGHLIFKKVLKNTYFWYAYFQAVPFWSETKIQNSDRTKASPSDCEENATRIIQIG